MVRSRSIVLALVLVAGGAAGCAAPATEGGGGSAGADPEGTSQIRVALSSIPGGVQCVRITVTNGGTTVTPPLLAVGSGASSASLSIGQLAAGVSTFNGTAFNVACASVGATTTPNWIAVPATVTLAIGLNNQVSLMFLANNPVSINANFVVAPVEVDVGIFDSYVRMADGSIRAWGQDPFTQGIFNSVAAWPPGVTDAVQIAPGAPNGTCIRHADGSISCWGSGSIVGNGTGAGTSLPVTIAQSPGFGYLYTQVSTGNSHACAMGFDAVFCWGDNSSGQFGNGTTTGNSAPAFVNIVAAKVFAGYSDTCFVKSDGTLACAGVNANGQLGNGTTTNATTPVTVPGLTDVVGVALGQSHGCALRSDGTVRCWGANTFGQVGDGTTTQRLLPVQVSGITDAVLLGAGANHTCVLRQAGTVSCWGKGDALGDGIGNNRSTPGDVGLTGVVAMDTHLGNHTCVIMNDRSVRCWGENTLGQIDATLVFAGKPTAITLQ